MNIKKFYYKILVIVLLVGFRTPLLGQQNTTRNFKSHIVSKGDTPYSISKKYNTSIDELQKLNPNYNGIILIGQSIKVPDTKSAKSNNTPKTNLILKEKSNNRLNNTKKINESSFNNGVFYSLKNTSNFQLSYLPGIYSNIEELLISNDCI